MTDARRRQLEREVARDGDEVAALRLEAERARRRSAEQELERLADLIPELWRNDSIAHAALTGVVMVTGLRGEAALAKVIEAEAKWARTAEDMAIDYHARADGRDLVGDEAVRPLVEALARRAGINPDQILLDWRRPGLPWIDPAGEAGRLTADDVSAIDAVTERVRAVTIKPTEHTA